jgi:deoxyribose-phosphate aldolase
MDQDSRPPLTTYESLAGMIDHAMLSPHLTEDDVRNGCDLASAYQVATVTVRPADIDIAIRSLRGSNVAVASVAGFPHGSCNTATKIYEVRDLLRRGCREIDIVLNIGKLRSRQFTYLETELLQASKACHEEGAKLKVIIESAYLDLELKLIACKLVKRTESDFAVTSTGFAPTGAKAEDVKVMAEKLRWRAGVKAAQGIDSLDLAISLYEAGADRLGTPRTATILDAWRERLAAMESARSVPRPAAPTP